MRISDWSSDVCSSDLAGAGLSFRRYARLDVFHRDDFRAGRAAYSARHRRTFPAEGPMSLLQVHNVSQHFGQLVAVNDVSLTVEPGELHAIIGPNGAGKTTFFNMISGFYRPTRGRIVFDGADVTDGPRQNREI